MSYADYVFTKNLDEWNRRYNNMKQLEKRLEWVREKIIAVKSGRLGNEYRAERDYIKEKISAIRALNRKLKRRRPLH